MSKTFLSVLILTAGVVSSGCEDKAPQPPLASPQPAAGPVATPPAAAKPGAAGPQAPAGGPAAAMSQAVSAMGLSVSLPAGWKQNPPANQMRLAEASVPDASGDPAKACLVVFSTAGGSVEDNIARWSGQVRDAKGQPVPAKTETRTVNGLKVTVTELTGSFSGMGDATPKENWTLRGAIVEGADGLLFIKMTGPAASMAAAAPGFNALVDSVKKP